jgi:tRNA pseudouridine38-40 synthase
VVTEARRHVRIDLGYDGRAFFGSQRQASVRTVQRELESVLRRVTSDDRAQVAFAGRTDRGVHAVGQVASGSVQWSGELERLRYALDRLTPDDIVVNGVTDVDGAFHARFSARSREYRYRIVVSNHAPVLLRGLVWWLRSPLDVNRLHEASSRLVGDRDFRSFSGAGTGSGGSEVETQRLIESAAWFQKPVDWSREGSIYEFRVRANAFLPHMVRNLVGAQIEVGTGRRTVKWLDDLIAARDRRFAPKAAPPDGLTLWAVDYDNDELIAR